MKKIAVGFATLALTGVASAQSGVNMFGVVDLAVQHGSGSVSSRTSVAPSGLGASQLGFRGTEDLGGGLKAAFWLEATLAPDSGIGQSTITNNQNSGLGPAAAGGQGIVFNRRSTVSLAGNWGELRLGRDFSPHYSNLGAYDPWGNLGIGIGQTLLSNVTLAQGGIGGPTVRASNGIQYLWNHDVNGVVLFGGQGFHAAAMYYLGENNSGAANSKDGTGWGVRAGYNAGPFTIALATGGTKYATGDAKASNIGGSYDFGPAKLIAHYARSKLGTLEGHGFLIGGTVPAGNGYFRGALSQYENDATGSPKTTKLALGYVYTLSKRSAIYFSGARVRNSGGATQSLGGSVTGPNQGSTGMELGMRHAF